MQMNLRYLLSRPVKVMTTTESFVKVVVIVNAVAEIFPNT